MAMYLSRLEHILNNVRTRRSLSDPYEMHRLIWRAFPDNATGGPGRVLFRTEEHRRQSAMITLVQSEKEPDWNPLEHEGLLLASYKPYAPIVASGQRLRFRLRANPTRRVGDKSDKLHGKRVGIYGEGEQREWLLRKAIKSGFEVTDVLITSRENVVSSTRSKKAQHFAVDFDGILCVSDASAFIETLRKGIGPAKAFGFGLLSVARA
jgi:CRISPR system Cascade subunit CasE